VFFQQVEHALVVSRGFENVLTVVAPQNHMMRVTREGETRKTSHPQMVTS
jgi:hypothetical protein